MAHLRNGQFGRYTNLKEISVVDNSTNEKDSNKVPKPTRTIKISEQLYRRFIGHSIRYYNVETYETILENLLNNFDKNNQGKTWRDNE